MEHTYVYFNVFSRSKDSKQRIRNGKEFRINSGFRFDTSISLHKFIVFGGQMFR